MPFVPLPVLVKFSNHELLFMVWLRLSRAHHCGVSCGRPIDGALLASAASVARIRPWISQFQVLIPALCSASLAVP